MNVSSCNGFFSHDPAFKCSRAMDTVMARSGVNVRSRMEAGVGVAHVLSGWRSCESHLVRVSLDPQGRDGWRGFQMRCAKLGCSNKAERRKHVVCMASGGRGVYQPFRPPPTPGPLSGAQTTEEQLEILRERRGLWHEYASVVPALTRVGYNPSMIDEATGMTGVEQNRIVVASQVRSSLKLSGFDEAALSFFDIGGAELLYELRILSAEQRKASAEFVIERRLDPKDATELARAMKDFDRRKGVDGWSDFSSSPGDCLAFACFRQSREYKELIDIEAVLTKALDYAVTKKARSRLLEAVAELKGGEASSDTDMVENTYLQVLRLSEEAAGSHLPIILPVAEATSSALEEAPSRGALGEGPFKVCKCESSWKAWIPLPGWPSITSSVAPVGVLFPDASLLPLKANKGKGKTSASKEPVLLVVDKGIREPNDSESLFVVPSEDGQGLSVRVGTRVSGRVLGKVLIALRPPLPESEDPEDWE